MEKSNVLQVSKKSNVLISILTGVFAIICVLPFILVIMVSFTSESAIAKEGFSFWPGEFSVAAYEYILKVSDQLIRSYFVTILVTVLGTCITLVGVSLFSYAISRKNFKYRRFFTFLAFFTMLFNGGLVPTYMVIAQVLHLKNTIWALILPLAVNVFHIIVLKTFFATTIPDSIVDSAKIDGASEFYTFVKIVFPISLPGIATIGLFATLGYWNDWFNALLYITDEKLAPLQYLLMQIERSMQFMIQNSVALKTEGNALMQTLPRETSRMAMVILVTGPVVLAYPFFQKYFIQGLTIGAVKE